MITNKQVLQEVEQLKFLFKEGEAEIPTMWQCYWPGLAAMSWMVCWPLMLYGYKFKYFYTSLTNEARIGIAASIVIGFFAGLFIMLYIVNGRSLFLSIPKAFRGTSALCRFISTKARNYLMTYMISYAVLIVLCTWPVYGAIYSTVLLIVLSFGFVNYMNVDLNRYQLTALTSLLESLKSSGAK